MNPAASFHPVIVSLMDSLMVLLCGLRALRQNLLRMQVLSDGYKQHNILFVAQNAGKH